MNLSLARRIHYSYLLFHIRDTNMGPWDLSNSGQKANDNIHGKHQMPRDVCRRKRESASKYLHSHQNVTNTLLSIRINFQRKTCSTKPFSIACAIWDPVKPVYLHPESQKPFQQWQRIPFCTCQRKKGSTMYTTTFLYYCFPLSGFCQISVFYRCVLCVRTHCNGSFFIWWPRILLGPLQTSLSFQLGSFWLFSL